MKIKSIIVALILIFVLAGCKNTSASERTKEFLIDFQADPEYPDDTDLVVSFTFPTEIIDITFISPSGKKLTKNTAEWKGQNGSLEWAEGDENTGQTWSTYRIHNAEKGEWYIEYNLGLNGSIEDISVWSD